MNTITPVAAARLESPYIGIGAMLLSILLFSVMDAMVKWLGADYPTHQIMFFRCLVAMIPVTVIIYSRGGLKLLKTNRPALHLLRCLLGITAMALAFHAFSLMRLADAISIMHTTPIFMTTLSVIFLGESVGIHRWSAVLAGFSGMVIVIRPGSGMLESGGLLMLSAAFLIACTTIIIRRLSSQDDPICITFYFTVTGVIVSSIGMLLFGWVMPSARDLFFFVAVGLCGGVAQFLMTLSYQHSEIAIVAPLKYLSIAYGGIIAYLVWTELPDRQSFIGISIIVISGLYTLYREWFHASRQA